MGNYENYENFRFGYQRQKTTNQIQTEAMSEFGKEQVTSCPGSYVRGRLATAWAGQVAKYHSHVTGNVRAHACGSVRVRAWKRALGVRVLSCVPVARLLARGDKAAACLKRGRQRTDAQPSGPAAPTTLRSRTHPELHCRPSPRRPGPGRRECLCVPLPADRPGIWTSSWTQEENSAGARQVGKIRGTNGSQVDLAADPAAQGGC